MNYFDVWTIVAIFFTFNVAYFSYKSGYKNGVTEGVETTIDQLSSQGIIELEEEHEE